jgi:hypothetical protein
VNAELEIVWKEAVMASEVCFTSMVPNLLVFNVSESVNGSGGIIPYLSYIATPLNCVQGCALA